MASKNRRQRRKEQRLAKKKQLSQPTADKKKTFLKTLETFYVDEYKKLMILPFAILLIALIILFSSYARTGEFITKGVSITGGVSVTIPTNDLQSEDVKFFLESRFPTADIEARTLSSAGEQVAVIIEASQIDEDILSATLAANYDLDPQSYTVEVTGSSLGKSFYRQIITAIILAFIFMGVLVFFYFRTVIPSIAIILAALSDMIITLSVISLLKVRITTAGIAAFLMLIGYSVDTDILLTTKVLKRTEGTVMQRIFSAMKTGMTMNITTLFAVTVAFFVSDSEVLKQIMMILIIGLLADIINTWIQNVGLLRWYLERVDKK